MDHDTFGGDGGPILTPYKTQSNSSQIIGDLSSFNRRGWKRLARVARSRSNIREKDVKNRKVDEGDLE